MNKIPLYIEPGGVCATPQSSGFGLRVSGFRFRVSGFGSRASGFRFRVSGFRFRASDFEFRGYSGRGPRGEEEVEESSDKELGGHVLRVRAQRPTHLPCRVLSRSLKLSTRWLHSLLKQFSTDPAP